MFGLRPSQQPIALQAPVSGAVVAPIRHTAHENRYPCVECAEHFASVVDRATHLRTTHSFAEGFLCHECVSSCSDQAQYSEHQDDHSRDRFDIATYCEVSWCNFEDCSAEVVDRHRRDDHNSDDSLRAQCPDCAYTNDSIVGISVHKLYVHTEEGRSLVEAARRARESKMLADKAAATAAAREASDSSSSETVEGSQSANLAGTTAQLAPVRPMAASDALLADQMRAYDGLSAADRQQFGLNHKERKKFKVAAKKKAGKS